MDKPTKKKKYRKIWTALILCLFSWIPLINIAVLLPLALYFIIHQIILIKKSPEEYGGMILSVPCLILIIFLFVMGVRGLIISFTFL